MKITKTRLKKIIKEELQTVLKEAEATPFRIGMKIVEDWRPHAGSPGAFAKAWQSLFQALDDLPDGEGMKIATQLKEISDDYLKSSMEQQDEREESREKEREERRLSRAHSTKWRV
jgi:hypothetical protein